MVYKVETLHSSRLGDRKKWLFLSIEEARFKQESMHGLSAKKLAVAREVAVNGGLIVPDTYLNIRSHSEV